MWALFYKTLLLSKGHKTSRYFSVSVEDKALVRINTICSIMGCWKIVGLRDFYNKFMNLIMRLHLF